MLRFKSGDLGTIYIFGDGSEEGSIKEANDHCTRLVEDDAVPPRRPGSSRLCLADVVRAPPMGETVAHPYTDEVIVFRDLFTAGLRMPLDPVVVDIFCLFTVYLHQMTPTSIVRLNLYMWLAKTCRLSPSAEGFARAFRVHY